MGAISRRGLFTFDFGARPRGGAHWVRVHRIAMACRFEVTLDESDRGSIAHAREALNEADRVEALLSIFRESSEISRINREGAFGAPREGAPGEGAAGAEMVDAEVLALLQRSVAIAGETEGAFDITSTPLSRCWGFIKRDGRVPRADEIDEARATVGMHQVSIDPDARGIRFDREGVELNLGAIGKGYALDRMGALLRMRRVRAALISAGASSILAIGGPGGGWPIDLRSPRIERSRIARVHLRDGALGTSGAGEQFVVEDGTRYGHVIDPRTGWPAGEVLSATVVTRDAERADALSTAFLVGGPALAERYCGSHPDTLAVLTLEADPAHPRVIGAYPGATVALSQ